MYQLLWWLSGWRICLQYRRHRRWRFDPWAGKIPWRRKWQPSPVFLLEKSHGQRSLAGCSPWDYKELNVTEVTHTHTHTHMHTHTHAQHVCKVCVVFSYFHSILLHAYSIFLSNPVLEHCQFFPILTHPAHYETAFWSPGYTTFLN